MILQGLLAATFLAGTVVSGTDSSVVIQLTAEHERMAQHLEKKGLAVGDQVTVDFTDETRMQDGATYEVGEHVFVRGSYEDGTIEAKTITDHAPKHAMKVRHHVRKHVREHRAERAE